MIKFREDIESRMTQTNNKIALVAALEYKFDLFEKQILKLDQVGQQRNKTNAKYQDKMQGKFTKIKTIILELKLAQKVFPALQN